MQTISVVVYTIVFSCIAMTRDPISCNSPVDYTSFADYARFVIQRVVVEVIIDFIAEGFAACVNAAGRVAE